MKTKIAIAMAVMLACSVVAVGTGCDKGILWEHEQALALEITSPSFETRDGYSMLVIYQRDTRHFVISVTGSHSFVVMGDQLYMDDNTVVVNGVATLGWGLYPEQSIALNTEWDEQLGEITLPTTMEELNLVDFTAETLPQSGHYAKLVDVHPGDILKAEVSRPFYGKWYDGIRCLVTLSVYQAYPNDIQIGDIVWVYYTNDPRPGHENEEIPIVIDKVMYP